VRFRVVVPPIARTRSAISSIAAKIRFACSSSNS
jgi:hypothetical protein